jgi:hypothetical protein
MKRIISIFLIIITLLGCLSMTACSSRKSSNHEYGYYTRSDGKRIWFKK